MSEPQKSPSVAVDAEVAGRYFDQNIVQTLNGLGAPGVEALRRMYVRDVLDNVQAVEELREWAEQNEHSVPVADGDG